MQGFILQYLLILINSFVAIPVKTRANSVSRLFRFFSSIHLVLSFLLLCTGHREGQGAGEKGAGGPEQGPAEPNLPSGRSCHAG